MKSPKEFKDGKESKDEKKIQKKVEKAEAKELRFKQTLRALSDGVVLMSKDWEIQWMNPMAERDLHLDSLADIGKKIQTCYPDGEFLSKVTKGDGSLQTETLEGRIIEVRVISAGSKYRILVTRDVTEQKRSEDFRRDFVANVSHELRTPLTVIKGFLELAEDWPLNSQQERHLDLMYEQVKRMGTLVNDLLTLSRLERDSAPAAKDPIDLTTLLTDAAVDGRFISQGNHSIVLEHVEKVTILGDIVEMKSAVTNLVSNAVRYTPQGGTIVVSTFMTEEGLVISVKDNGIGIAAEAIPRVTERFYRVDKSRSRETGGTGLGLAIVKHVLFRHQARLKILSELGKGSDFQIILPKERVEKVV